MVEKICSAVMLRLGAFDLLCPVVRSGLKKTGANLYEDKTISK